MNRTGSRPTFPLSTMFDVVKAAMLREVEVHLLDTYTTLSQAPRFVSKFSLACFEYYSKGDGYDHPQVQQYLSCLRCVYPFCRSAYSRVGHIYLQSRSILRFGEKPGQVSTNVRLIQTTCSVIGHTGLHKCILLSKFEEQYIPYDAGFASVLRRVVRAKPLRISFSADYAIRLQPESA